MNSWQKKFHRQLLHVFHGVTPKKQIVTPRVTQKISQKAEKNFPHRVNCTLSKKEYDSLQKISSRVKISPTALLKKAAFSHLKERAMLSPAGEEKLQNLILEIRKIGTNINQIAKHANTFQKVGFADLRESHKRISELETLLQEAIVSWTKK